MRIPRVLFRTGICITIIGLSIFLANLTFSLRSFTGFTSFQVPANGTCSIISKLQNRPYEIRIFVSEDFNGTLCVFNYEGIKKLTEGTKTPTLEQTLEGPILIDFTPNRRGAYMFLIESKVSEIAVGSIGLVGKEAISQDIQEDSIIIIFLGLATTGVTLMFRSNKPLKKNLRS